MRPSFMKNNHIYRHYYILTYPTYMMVLECFSCLRFWRLPPPPPAKVILSSLINHYVMALYNTSLSSKRLKVLRQLKSNLGKLIQRKCTISSFTGVSSPVLTHTYPQYNYYKNSQTPPPPFLQ